MSIIQDIRDKYAKVTVILIALALIGFILTDYFQGKARSAGGGGSNSIGSVNGKSINYDEYLQVVEQTKQNMQAQGYPAASIDAQVNEQAWNQQIGRMLIEQELDKLGITVGKKEMGDILYGPNAPEDLKRQFTDSATGQYDGVKAKQAVDQMLKSKDTDPERKAQFNNYIAGLKEQRLNDKFISLLSNTINQPRWLVEKQTADASQMAKISYVNETYASIPDSTVKIEDKMIADFINKHKDMFKQQESRSISFVSFSAKPSAADSSAAVQKLITYKPAFDSVADVSAYLQSLGMNTYYDGYINGKTIQVGAKDSIFRSPVGSVYGPYLDGENFAMARVEGVRQMLADTVKVRHILISTQQGRDSATAKNLADSIMNAVAKGSNFDSLCMQFSEDPGSKDKGGVYDNVTSGSMVPAFNDFCFFNPTGTKRVIKTEFGYHYMEIMSQKGGGPGYKIAYMFQEIIPSKETDRLAQENAMKFASQCKDIKSFDEAYEKEWKAKGFIKSIATNIAPSSSQAGAAGNSRQLVRNIYKAKLGEVLQPEPVNENYIVAVVTEVEEEGTMSVAKARMFVELTLRNKKKAEILKQKIGKVSTLEDAAAKLGGKQIVTVDSVRIGQGTSVLGYEPRIVGASFNPSNNGKIVPEALEGVNGVYVVRVDSVRSTPVTLGDVATQRKTKEMQQMQYMQNPQSPFYPPNILRMAATIKDRRSKLL